MKKLGKLNINSEKLMKNEELTTMRGGYGGYGGCGCVCYDWNYQLIGAVSGQDALSCNPACLQYFGHGFGNWSC
jgi:natural product precursor